MSDVDERPRETNWAGNYEYAAKRVLRPRTVEELSELVSESGRIRALGSRHSFTDLADSPGNLVSLLDLPREIEVDDQDRVVRVAAGVTYGQLSVELDRAGWALGSMASLPHITVAGAVATGTHGSGDAVGSLASTVCSLEVVGAGGELRTTRRGDPTFAGEVVALGALGVVTHLSLELEPSFDVRQEVFLGLGWDDLRDHFDALMSGAYSVSIFTDWVDPAATQVWVKSRSAEGEEYAAEALLTETSRATDPVHMLRGVPPESVTPQLGEVGPWHERLPHFRTEFVPSSGAELQSEYFVPRRHAVAACEALRGLGGRIRGVLQVSEIRTVAADDLWLSGAYAEDVVGFHFTWVLDPVGVLDVLPVLEAELRPFGARPHWGKCFTLTAPELAEVYPRLPDFARLRDEIDPSRTFGNAFLDRCLGRRLSGGGY